MGVVTDDCPFTWDSDSMTKTFVCPEKSCGKSFRRREHLRRHEFNHKDGDFTCARCAAHFRRRDLLGMFFSKMPAPAADSVLEIAMRSVTARRIPKLVEKALETWPHESDCGRTAMDEW